MAAMARTELIRGFQGFTSSSAAFPGHKQGGRQEAEQPEHNIRIPAFTGGGLAG